MGDDAIFKCVQYFKQTYTAHFKFGLCKCQPTAFHNALINGDLEFVKAFLEALHTEEAVANQNKYNDRMNTSINETGMNNSDLPNSNIVCSDYRSEGSYNVAFDVSMSKVAKEDQNTTDDEDVELSTLTPSLKHFVLNTLIHTHIPWRSETRAHKITNTGAADANSVTDSATTTVIDNQNDTRVAGAEPESGNGTLEQGSSEHNVTVKDETTKVNVFSKWTERWCDIAASAVTVDPVIEGDGKRDNTTLEQSTSEYNDEAVKGEESAGESAEGSVSYKWSGRWWARLWADGLIQCCLSMALYSRNSQLVQLLLAEGADPTKCDSEGENCVHHLVRMGDKWPDLAVDMFARLRESLSADVLKASLKQENLQQRNPLDLSAKLGVPEMMLCILNTHNVYKFRIAQYANKVCSVYDIGEYEGKGRKADKSVLFRLTDMDEEQVVRAKRCGLLSREPIKSWYEMKYAAYHRVKIMFIAFWVIFVSFFYLDVIMILNDSCGDMSYTFFSQLTVTTSILYMVFELAYIKADLKMIFKTYRETIQSGKFPVTFTFAYRVFQMLFAVFAFTAYWFQGSAQLSVMVLNAIFAILALLMFFQLSSCLGHVLIVLQKMMYDVTVFASMDILLFFGFTMAFHLMYCVGNAADDCTSNTTTFEPSNNQTQQQAALTFASRKTTSSSSVSENPFEYFYSSCMYIFLMMIGIVAPSDVTFDSAPLPGLARLLYVVLVIVGGIVFINLLIALMSVRLEAVNQCKDEILKLEKLCILQYMEVRLKTRLSRRLMHKLHSLKWMRKYSEQRTRSPLRPFMFDAAQTELFLEVVEEVRDMAGNT